MERSADLDPQSRLNLIYGSDTIDAIIVGDGRVLLAGVVAEQKDLLAVEGVFRPGNVRQRAGGGGTARVVGILMVDEVDWCGSPSSAAKTTEGRFAYVPKASTPT